MIFSVADHVEQIVNGTKTQTRRDSGKYEVGRTYAIQPGRTKPADPRGRILITHNWLEHSTTSDGEIFQIHPIDAEAEGGYGVDEYEKLYDQLHPEWKHRWVYEFEFWSAESIETLKRAAKEAKENPSIPYWPLPSRLETSKRIKP